MSLSFRVGKEPKDSEHGLSGQEVIQLLNSSEILKGVRGFGAVDYGKFVRVAYTAASQARIVHDEVDRLLGIERRVPSDFEIPAVSDISDAAAMVDEMLAYAPYVGWLQGLRDRVNVEGPMRTEDVEELTFVVCGAWREINEGGYSRISSLRDGARVQTSEGVGILRCRRFDARGQMFATVALDGSEQTITVSPYLLSPAAEKPKVAGQLPASESALLGTPVIDAESEAGRGTLLDVSEADGKTEIQLVTDPAEAGPEVPLERS